MWKTRDYGILAAAALATFGLTVGTFWPRLANAVDEKPAATTEVKVPTLTLGSVQITAKLDTDKPHAVIFTITNTGYEPTSTEFLASANVGAPSSPLSRTRSLSKQVWTGDFTLDLKPNESQTLAVALPDEAFGGGQPTPQQSSQLQQNNAASQLMRTVPGSSSLILTDSQRKQSVTVLALSDAGPAPAPVRVVTAVAPAQARR